jgi:tagatose-1,6-bisphosphate aldolase
MTATPNSLRTDATEAPEAPDATGAHQGLAAIADEQGVFSIVAMDQRNTLKRMFQAVGKEAEVSDLHTAKVDVAAALTPLASAILLDPTFGVPAVNEAGALAESCGLLVAAEPGERGTYQGEPRTHRDPALNAGWVRSQGGDAVKFLVQLRPWRPDGGPDLAAEVLDVVREVVADCREAGVPSVIENLIYPLPGEQLTAVQREDLIVEAARMLADTGADLVKLEYPGSARGCRRIAQVVRQPWAVLSAGVGFEEFQRVLRDSCEEGGASGFIAGRSIWKEAIGLEGAARAEFLDTVARKRLETCVASAAGRARPWTEAVSAR